MTTNLPMIRASNSLAPIAASTVPPAIRDSLGDILVAFSAGGRDDDRPRLLKLYAKALSGFEEIVAARALDHLLTHNPRNPFQPTPQDLHEACVRIRDEWSSAVRQHYILGGDRVGVSIPAPIVAGLMREWTSDPGMQSKLVTIDAERYDRLPPEFFEPGRKAEIDALRVARKEAEDEARKRKAELERAEDVRRAEKAKRDAEDRAREAEKEARWCAHREYVDGLDPDLRRAREKVISRHRRQRNFLPPEEQIIAEAREELESPKRIAELFPRPAQVAKKEVA